MSENAHIHDDDLQLYIAGHLEPERILALELHLSNCRDCRERLEVCIVPRAQGRSRASNAATD